MKSQTKKYKNTGKSILRFSLGKDEHTVLPGRTVHLPEGPYVAGLVGRGVLVESPAPASAGTTEQTVSDSSKDAGTEAPKTPAESASPARTTAARSTVKTSGN